MKNLIIPFIFALIILASCEENPIKIETQEMTIESILTTPAYSGFGLFYNLFTPNQDYINQINQAFDKNSHKILFFLSPSCYQCGRIDSISPYIVKILSESNIPDTSYEIYSMQYFSSKHPYMDIITLKSLPEFWVLKNGVPVYNMADSIFNFIYSNPEQPLVFEKYFLESLQK